MIEKYFRFPFIKFMVGGAVVFLAACGNQTAAEPTATIAQLITKNPTETSNPTATNTSIPTDTLTPTITSTPTPETIAGPERPQFLQIPSGTPITEWEGIPVLPEAIAGGEVYGGYFFSVEMPVTEVMQYYQQIMSRSGLRLFAIGAAEDGSLKLVFQNSSDQVSISIFNIESSFEHPLWGFQAPASFVLIIH